MDATGNIVCFGGFGILETKNTVKELCYYTTNFVALVRKRTKPTERPPRVGEVSANFSG
jgi:hypothetical protein